MRTWQAVWCMGAMVLCLALTACHFSEQPVKERERTTQKASRSLSQKLMQPLIEDYCQQEVKKQPIWQGFQGLSEYAKTQTLQRVCQCIARHAPQDLTFSELAQWGIDEEVRPKLIEKTLTYSIDACVVEFNE